MQKWLTQFLRIYKKKKPAIILKINQSFKLIYKIKYSKEIYRKNNFEINSKLTKAKNLMRLCIPWKNYFQIFFFLLKSISLLFIYLLLFVAYIVTGYIKTWGISHFYCWEWIIIALYNFLFKNRIFFFLKMCRTVIERFRCSYTNTLELNLYLKVKHLRILYIVSGWNPYSSNSFLLFFFSEKGVIIWRISRCLSTKVPVTIKKHIFIVKIIKKF